MRGETIRGIQAAILHVKLVDDVWLDCTEFQINGDDRVTFRSSSDDTIVVTDADSVVALAF